jgi:Cwf15/Cwc15 cell cycle control protein
MLWRTAVTVAAAAPREQCDYAAVYKCWPLLAADTTAIAAAAATNTIVSQLVQEAAMSGNVLLNPLAGSSQVKRRWNDDVVFKGQVKLQHTLKLYHYPCQTVVYLY